MPRTLTALVATALLLAGCGGSSRSSGTADGGSSSTVTTQGAADAQTVTIGMTDKLTFTPV